MQRLASTPPLVLLALFVAVLTACRIAVLIATPLNLGPDEAQYWSWSLTPAFGYFSKPPMIAWLIGASTAICGDGEACIRITAPLMHGASALFVFFAARTLYDERTGLWSAAAYALMPGTSFSSLLITTDVPLLFFWALALLALAELRRKPSALWAIVFGLAIGLGLISKYAMLYFVLGIALAFIPTIEGRSLLFSRWGAIALAAAAATFAPNLAWNVLHKFETVAHTVDSCADDRRRIVGKDARQHRQVSGGVAHRAGEFADCLLALGHRIQVAHRNSPQLPRSRRSSSACISRRPSAMTITNIVLPLRR